MVPTCHHISPFQLARLIGGLNDLQKGSCAQKIPSSVSRTRDLPVTEKFTAGRSSS